MIKKVLMINGVERTLVIDGTETLATILRERLLLTGCKIGCGQGHCGACNVIVDGKVTKACITKVVKLRDYAEITTIEGLQDPVTNELDPIQQAFIDEYAFQCGYCTPGIIMTSRALFNHNPHPTREEIAEALSGNYCRCISHYHVLDALEKLSKKGVEE